MATFQSIFAPNKERATSAAILAGASTASIVIGSSASATLFVITVSGDCTIRFGDATNIGDPTAADWPLWAGSISEFQLPVGCDRFRVFSAGGATYWYWGLGRS